MKQYTLYETFTLDRECNITLTWQRTSNSHCKLNQSNTNKSANCHAIQNQGLIEERGHATPIVIVQTSKCKNKPLAYKCKIECISGTLHIHVSVHVAACAKYSTFRCLYYLHALSLLYALDRTEAKAPAADKAVCAYSHQYICCLHCSKNCWHSKHSITWTVPQMWM